MEEMTTDEVVQRLFPKRVVKELKKMAQDDDPESDKSSDSND